MNKSLRNILSLCGVVAFMGTFFSCWEGDWQYPIYRRVDCNIPKFYDDKQGSYKGIVFLQNTNSILDTISTFVEVKLGDYADKTFEIQGFPLGCFLQYLDETAYSKIPSEIKGKKINLSYRYFLYGELPDFEGDSIKSDYLGALYTDISYESRQYLDSIYNEDKTQKLKYCIYAYNKEGEFNAIRLELYQLELNDSIIGFPYCYNAKIKFDNEKVKVE